MTRQEEELWATKIHTIRCYGVSENMAWIFSDLNDKQRIPKESGRCPGSSIYVTAPTTNKLQPIGAWGEITISGSSLARGYIKDTERQEQRFILMTEETSRSQDLRGPTRVFKTGSIGRFNSNGSISIVGRTNTRVRIGRHVVDLWETEEAIASFLLANLDVAVDILSSEHNGTSPTVVGFISGYKEDSKAFEQFVAKVKDHLRKYPEYMRPRNFFPLDQLPIDCNGTLNRDALRTLAKERLDSQRSGIQVNENVSLTNLRLSKDESIALDLNRKLVDFVSEVDESRGHTLQGENTDLSDWGIDSMQVTSLAMHVQDNYNVRIPLRNYLRTGFSIRDLANLIGAETCGVENLQRTEFTAWEDCQALDLQLSKTIPARSVSHPSSDQTGCLLLTGATGIIGNQILRQLLSDSSITKVVILTRGDNLGHARQRVFASARKARWWSPALIKRTEVWVGDLRKTKFGLEASQWDRLCGRSGIPGVNVDTIIHAAYVFDWTSAYSALRDVNILSTFELLQVMASSPALRSFTYVSRNSFPLKDADIWDDPMQAIEAENLQGKHVSEFLVYKYAERFALHANQDIRIVKPGIVIGTGTEGVCNSSDFIWRLVTSSILSGGFSKTEQNAWLPIVGVDDVAENVVAVATSVPTGVSRSIMKHVTGGITAGQFWSAVSQALDLPLKGISLFEWTKTLGAQVEKLGKAHPLAPVMQLLENVDGKVGQTPPRLDPYDLSIAKKSRVLAAISKSIEYLASTEELDQGRLVTLLLGRTAQ